MRSPAAPSTPAPCLQRRQLGMQQRERHVRLLSGVELEQPDRPAQVCARRLGNASGGLQR